LDRDKNAVFGRVYYQAATEHTGITVLGVVGVSNQLSAVLYEDSPCFSPTARIASVKIHNTDEYNGSDVLFARLLESGYEQSRVPELPETWPRQLLLHAGMFQKELRGTQESTRHCPAGDCGEWVCDSCVVITMIDYY